MSLSNIMFWTHSAISEQKSFIRNQYQHSTELRQTGIIALHWKRQALTDLKAFESSLLPGLKLDQQQAPKRSDQNGPTIQKKDQPPVGHPTSIDPRGSKNYSRPEQAGAMPMAFVSQATQLIRRPCKIDSPLLISIHDLFDALVVQNWLPRNCG